MKRKSKTHKMQKDTDMIYCWKCPCKVEYTGRPGPVTGLPDNNCQCHCHEVFRQFIQK